MSNESLFKKCLKEKILFLDGAMGTLLQKYNLSENDYRGTLFKNSTINLKGNFEVLSLTQPQIIEDIHFLQLLRKCSKLQLMIIII